MKSSPISWTLAFIIILFSSVDCASTDKYTIDLKIKYFANGYLTCDHPMLNITRRSDVDSLFWIMEDGSLVTSNSKLNPKQYILQGLPDGVKAASQPNSKYDGYNLTILDADDDVFGYYTCVILFTNSIGHPKIAAIRYGLNINGADFSDLMDEYKHNAIVGGIAAGVLLVLIVVIGFVWYNWCYEKVPEEEEEGLDDVEMEKRGNVNSDDATYHNDGFHVDKEDIEKDQNMKDNSSPEGSRL